MRCKNCGWPNKPEATNCAKCNTPLVNESYDVEVNDTVRPQAPTSGFSKTVLEDDIFGNREAGESNSSNPASGKEAELKNCPKCGYPIRPGGDKCPNCNFSLSVENADVHSRREEPSNQSNVNGSRRPTRLSNDNPGGMPYRGTVNPYIMNIMAEPSFVLKPIKRLDERHELDEIELEGSNVVLNRENTEPNNPSITSREQAVITYSDGNWYIQDKSEQKTTFVQAQEAIPLHDGDIILLGNRLFEFHK